MLAHLGAEGENRWRMVLRVTPNEEDVTEVRFISKKHERPLRIPTDPVTGEIL